MPKVKKKHPKTDVKIRGFFHLQIQNPDGEIIGDSGWCENNIPEQGFQHFIVQLMGQSTGSSYVGYAALGEGTEPGNTATALESEISGSNGSGRKVTTFSETGSKTAQWVCTFASSSSHVTATETIKNVGLFAVSGQGVGTIFAGNTYATSTLATNQSVNLTYQVRFSTS